MPLTSYCKKCGQDVPVGDFCPECHGKLAANTVRLAWCIDHAPVRDWMCWNAAFRLISPVAAAVLMLLLLLECILGGFGHAMLLLGSLLTGLMGLTVLLVAVLLLVFILQGEDVQDCVIDSKGIHVTTYLPEPTRLKLLLRGKSPVIPEDGGMALVQQQEILWKDIRRVQLWPEKTLLLLYAPTWWMRVALPCTPFTWVDALDFIREKIGRKKDVVLPECCRQVGNTAPKPRKPQREQQLTVEDVYIPAQPIPPEEVPPEAE